ncbi:uncharacterized protein Z520_05101 [Fonsecaea multimorphosa CBS 102226]|uniref:SnoaL-like domain-containing protein n=1 Tax=Fonsecaea multimorphosa CBS 102226 TaxID=1442371 RepID=A0A0D2HCA2_9EURO|nr:uncharacterized protein Z520_05101 [Fonsecaea multimorphosa CBS 102226]KIX99525.1 hypothetical protein Z520_05101 [Fonsecaea multimorphosa CBS 102226]OAL25518.1 hypothetical protein AYO22_04837 [Fonsecaea multimorphosa]
MAESTHELHTKYEPHPDPQQLTGHDGHAVDYEPHPEQSLKISPEHEAIVQSITNLYSGSASEKDMSVYAEKAIYDDPLSYCDTRYKIAGQWYGLPKIFSKLETKRVEVVKDTPTGIVFKLRQEYTPKVANTPKEVDSLVSLSLDEAGKVRYHKDMWNSKDYSHSGIGKLIKNLNGDHLPKITQPPDSL